MNYENDVKLQNFLLRFMGLSQDSLPFLKYFAIVAFLPVSLILAGLSIYELLFRCRDVVYAAAIFEAISSFGQPIIRLYMMVRYWKVIQDILMVAQTKFWSYNMYGRDLGKMLGDQMVLAWFLVKGLWFLSFNTCVSVVVLPIITGSSFLPLACWCPESETGKWVAYWAEILGIVAAHVTIVVFDGFFVLMCTEIKAQFALLNEALGTLKMDADGTRKLEMLDVDNLIVCIKYQNLLLSVFDKLRTVYSEFFIGQYFISLSGICIEAFIMTEFSHNLLQNVKSTIYCVALMLQMSLMFIPASNITEEAENVSSAIYSINWYETKNLNIRKQILFMLMKAQKPLYMSGGGMFCVNKNSLIQILRMAFSIVTILTRMTNLTGIYKKYY